MFNVMEQAFKEAKQALDAAKAEKQKQADSWEQKAEVIEDAMEFAGISGVDVQIDESGMATLVGDVASETQMNTAVKIAEEFELNGLDVQINVVDVQVEEADDTSIWAQVEEKEVTYTAVKGDSWWGIAKRFYGDGRKWKALKAANGNPRMLHPGHEVKVPAEGELAG